MFKIFCKPNQEKQGRIYQCKFDLEKWNILIGMKDVEKYILSSKMVFFFIKRTKKYLKSCGEGYKSDRFGIFSSIYFNYSLRIYQHNSDHFVPITTQFFTRSYRLCLEITVPCHLSGPFQTRNFVIMCEYLYIYTPAIYFTGLKYVKQPFVFYKAINI